MWGCDSQDSLTLTLFCSGTWRSWMIYCLLSGINGDVVFLNNKGCLMLLSELIQIHPRVEATPSVWSSNLPTSHKAHVYDRRKCCVIWMIKFHLIKVNKHRLHCTVSTCCFSRACNCNAFADGLLGSGSTQW